MVPHIPISNTGLRPHKSEIHPHIKLPAKLPTKKALPRKPAFLPTIINIIINVKRLIGLTYTDLIHLYSILGKSHVP